MTLILLLFTFIITLTNAEVSARYQRIYIWGNGQYHQNGQSTDQDIGPQRLDVDNYDFSILTKGMKGVCMTRRSVLFWTEGGDLYFIGEFDLGAYGVLSRATDTTHSLTRGNISNVEEVFCSTEFCYAIDTNSTLWGWGQNEQYRGGFTDEDDGRVALPVDMSTVEHSDLSDTDKVLAVGIGDYCTMFFTQDRSESSEFSFFNVGEECYYLFGLEVTNVTRFEDSLLMEAHDQKTLKKIIGSDRFFFILYENGDVYIRGEDEFPGLQLREHALWGCENVLTGKLPNATHPSLPLSFWINFTECEDNVQGGVSSLGELEDGDYIIDIVCNSDTCVALTNEGTLHSWGFCRKSGRVSCNETKSDFGYVAGQVFFPGSERVRWVTALDTGFQAVTYDETEGKEKVYVWGDDTSNAGLFTGVEGEYFQTPHLFDFDFGDDFTDESISLVNSIVGVNPVYILPLKCGEYYSDEDEVCTNGRGTCEVNATDHWYCDCVDVIYSGRVCDGFFCNGLTSGDEDVCNGHGECIDSDTCVCEEGYDLDENNCYPVCDGLISTDEDVCNGIGICVQPELCDCKGEKEGLFCDSTRYNPIIYLWPIIPLMILCCCCTCCFCVYCICCCCCCLYCLTRVKLLKYKKLEDIEIILKEQELERKSRHYGIPNLRVTQNLFEVNYHDMKIICLIGQGGGGAAVYKVKWRGQICALKCFRTQDVANDQNQFDEFEREVSIIASTNHPYIITFYGATLEPPKVGILMEFCPNGDLRHFIIDQYQKNDGEPYPYVKKLQRLKETCAAMEFLHSKGIIHRDLKCENVLVNAEEVCKLMDFGLSKVVEDFGLTKTTGIGTSNYMAPEVVRGEKYDERCDVFSFAIMIYEVLTNNFKPYGEKVDFVEFKVANNPFFRPDLKVLEVPRWIKQLMKTCWDDKKEQRYSFSEIFEKFEIYEKQKNNVLLFIKKKSDEEDEAEDVELTNLTLKGLESVIKKNFPKEFKISLEEIERRFGKGTYRSKIEFVIKPEVKVKGEWRKIEEDEDVIRLDDELLVQFEVKWQKIIPVQKLIEILSEENQELEKNVDFMLKQIQELRNENERNENERWKLEQQERQSTKSSEYSKVGDDDEEENDESSDDDDDEDDGKIEVNEVY